jgi:GMP reductase
MKIEKETKLDYVDVLIRPQKNALSSRRDVVLERTFKFPHTKAIWTGVPIIAANMDDVGTLSMMKVLSRHGLITALHKYHSLEECSAIDKEHAFFTVGIRDEGMSLLKGYIEKYGEPKMLLIDVANGYLEKFVDFIRHARALSPSSIIMAGNVVTGEMTRELVRASADIVKVGIGPGAVCTTRVMAGVGYPQLSAVIECVKVAHKLGAFICADGGCRNPGDVAKAFGAGADFVMLGGMLSGHAEGGQTVIEVDGKKWVEHYGSSSRTAMEKHSGGKADYKASEGKKILVPYKGPVEDTIEEILGGLRSACTYVGAQKIEEMSGKTTFVRVNRQLSPSL